MGGGKAEDDAREQTRIDTELFRRYAQVGVPIMRQTQGYVRGALEQGEPGYVSKAYAAARGGADEEAFQAGRGLRGQLTGRSDGALLEGLTQAGAAGGRAFMEERAGVNVGQATNRIQQRNNLLGLLAGQGAQATSLSQGFGNLALRGIGVEAQGGDPFFEAAIGVGSAGAAGYLGWLQNRPGQTTGGGTPPPTNPFPPWSGP